VATPHDEGTRARPAGLDTTRPHPARVWNYFLRGKDDFAADWELGERVKAAYPGIVEVARESPAFLAVQPSQQRRGLGTWLMPQHHRILDRDGTAGYLEAANSRSYGSYLRLGWRMHDGPFDVAADGPPVYPMMREPLPTARRASASNAGLRP
jgi:GNAT superfamily N-acetyltransferase